MSSFSSHKLLESSGEFMENITKTINHKKQKFSQNRQWTKSKSLWGLSGVMLV